MNNTLNLLLADFAPVEGQELAIDRFEQWTNPPGGMLACTCGYWPAPDAELERAA